jgi:DNA-binding NtrC family response regulator
MNALLRHSWPGNVRELQNLMERAVSLSAPDEEISIGDLEGEIPVGGTTGGAAYHFADIAKPFHQAKEEAIETFERAYLKAILTEYDGNISHAAREAGIDRKTIHRLLNKYGLRVRTDRAIAAPAE